MTNNDQPIFDVGKKGKPIQFEIGVDIPTSKVAARAFLEGLGIGASVSMTQACATANLPLDKGWRAEAKQPHGPVKWTPKKYVAANDNEPVPPIFEALRRDGRDADIALIVRYRTLLEVVGATAYDDKIDLNDDSVNVEIRSSHLSGKNFEEPFKKAIGNDWTGTKLSGGEVEYHEQRQTAKQIMSTGNRINPTNITTGIRTETPLRLASSEDERIARIDSKPILAALRAGLGDLVYFFEDVALGQQTLTWLGDTLGYKHKARSREAKILVYTAIDRLRDQWRMIDRQMAASAAACDRAVEARRAELAAEHSRYLGLAA